MVNKSFEVDETVLGGICHFQGLVISVAVIVVLVAIVVVAIVVVVVVG